MPDLASGRPAADRTQPGSAPSAFSPFRSRIFLAMWIASLLSNFGSLDPECRRHMADDLACALGRHGRPRPGVHRPAHHAVLAAGRGRGRRLGQAADHAGRAGRHAGRLGRSRRPRLARRWSRRGFSSSSRSCSGRAPRCMGRPGNPPFASRCPGRELPAAVALNSVSFNLARAAGPALGGAIVAWAGAQVAFGVNAVSYLGLIAVLLSWKRPASEARLAAGDHGGGHAGRPSVRAAVALSPGGARSRRGVRLLRGRAVGPDPARRAGSPRRAARSPTACCWPPSAEERLGAPCSGRGCGSVSRAR